MVTSLTPRCAPQPSCVSPRASRSARSAAGPATGAVCAAWPQVTTPGPVADLAVGPGGEVWSTGTDGSVYQWNGTAFVAAMGTGTMAMRIAVGPSGTVWVVDANGDGYRGGATGFQKDFGL